MDLFQEYGKQLTVCIGLANMAQLQQSADQHLLPNIQTVQHLVELGVETWVAITPALPGITDVETMIAALPTSVSILLDRLRLFTKDSPPKQRFFEYLRANHPTLEARYQALALTGTDAYYEELKQRFHDNPRIKFVFGDV